jgi:hypothetical protein
VEKMRTIAPPKIFRDFSTSDRPQTSKTDQDHQRVKTPRSFHTASTRCSHPKTSRGQPLARGADILCDARWAGFPPPRVRVVDLSRLMVPGNQAQIFVKSRYSSNKESSRPLFSAGDILTMENKEKSRVKNSPALQLSGNSVAHRVADALPAAAQLECPGVWDQFEGAVQGLLEPRRLLRLRIRH